MTHTLGRFNNGKLNGDVTCRAPYGGRARIQWLSLTSGRELPTPRTQDQLDRREARCGCCGRSIPLDGVAVTQTSTSP